MAPYLDSACPARRRDAVYRVVTRFLAYVLLPAAVIGASTAARRLACRWALMTRFPRERLAGLDRATRLAFETARADALWLHGELIGLTDGYRSPEEQSRLFVEAVRQAGSPQAARKRVLPAAESRHVVGLALDVRPTEGARWLEQHGGRYGLFRVYANEWWHFEFCPQGPPPMSAHPGVATLPTGAGVAPSTAGSGLASSVGATVPSIMVLADALAGCGRHNR